jgi:hypothetical protein
MSQPVPPQVAVGAAHLALGDFGLQPFERERPGTISLADREFLGAANVIEIKDNQIGFPAIHAGVCGQIFADILASAFTSALCAFHDLAFSFGALIRSFVGLDLALAAVGLQPVLVASVLVELRVRFFLLAMWASFCLGHGNILENAIKAVESK